MADEVTVTLNCLEISKNLFSYSWKFLYQDQDRRLNLLIRMEKSADIIMLVFCYFCVSYD